MIFLFHSYNWIVWLPPSLSCLNLTPTIIRCGDTKKCKSTLEVDQHNSSTFKLTKSSFHDNVVSIFSIFLQRIIFTYFHVRLLFVSQIFSSDSHSSHWALTILYYGNFHHLRFFALQKKREEKMSKNKSDNFWVCNRHVSVSTHMWLVVRPPLSALTKVDRETLALWTARFAVINFNLQLTSCISHACE